MAEFLNMSNREQMMFLTDNKGPKEYYSGNNPATNEPWTQQEINEDLKLRRSQELEKSKKAQPKKEETFTFGDKGSLTIENINAEESDFKPVVQKNNEIKKLDVNFTRLDDDSASEEFNRRYGHLGFTAEPTGLLGGIGQFLKIKHNTDKGEGFIMPLKQIIPSGKQNFQAANEYMSKFAPNPSQEQIDQTYRSNNIIDNVISIGNQQLTKDQLQDVDEKANKAIFDKSTQQKISNWAQGASTAYATRIESDISNWVLSKGFDILARSLDQKGKAFKKAQDEIKEKTNEESEQYDKKFTEDYNKMNKQEQKDLLNSLAVKHKKIELTKEKQKGNINDYLDGLEKDERRFSEREAQAQIESKGETYKKNANRLNRIYKLTESYNKEVEGFNSIAETVIEDIKTGNKRLKDNFAASQKQAEKEIKEYSKQAIAKYQKLVNEGKMTVEEANSAYKQEMRDVIAEAENELKQQANIAQQDAATKITQLRAAEKTLADKKKFLDELKDEQTELEEVTESELKTLTDLSVAENYLDNIHSATRNLIAVLAFNTQDVVFGNIGYFGGSMLEKIASTATGGGALEGGDYDYMPLMTELELAGIGLQKLGKYAKEKAAENKTYLQDLEKGWNNVAQKALIGVAENLPLLALAAYTGGGSLVANMAAFGVSSAADKHFQMTKENDAFKNARDIAIRDGKEEFTVNGKTYNINDMPGGMEGRLYTEEQMILAPFAHGAFESITMIPELLMLRGAFKNANKFGNKSGNNLNTPSFYNAIGNKVLGFGKGFTKSTVGMELPQEIITQFGQNWTDKYLVGNKDVHLADGIDADFLIKVIGSAGTFYSVPQALQGTFAMLNGTYLQSEQQQMQVNSTDMLNNRIELNEINTKLENMSVDDPGFVELQQKQKELQQQQSKLNLKSEQLINKILGRFGKMDTKSVDKLRELAKEGAKIQTEAIEVKADKELTKSEKRERLNALQEQFNEVENKKAKIINNRSKYKLEHGNRINALEAKAAQNLKNKNKGKEPTKEQIEAEAERIFDKEHKDSDARVNAANRAVKDNINKFESESIIAHINKLDPSKPIEKFEATTLEEATRIITETLKEKGLNDAEINEQLKQLNETSWSNQKGKGSTAYIFTPNVKNGKVDPKTHMFDKHQIMLINSAKTLGGQFTARGHEILHAIVYKAFKASGKAFKPMAEAMLDRLEQTDPEGFNWLMGEVNDRVKAAKSGQLAPGETGRMASYINEDGTFSDAYFEEVVMAVADGMRIGKVKRTIGVINNIKRGLLAGGRAANMSDKNGNILINDAQDMLDILADYSASLKKGELSDTLTKLVQGKVAGELTDATAAEQRRQNDDIRSKASMDFLSRAARDAMNTASDAARSVKATNVNNAYQDYIDGKIDSFEALNRIGKEYDSMFEKAIKHFENENNITFDEFEKETFKFEAIHSSRGIRGSLFRDPNNPNKKIYDPSIIDTPARYLNGLLPQRMIEFGVEAIPSLDEKFAEDVTSMKNLEAQETATMTVDRETEKIRDTRDLSNVSVITEDITNKVKSTITSIITKGLSLSDNTQEILSEINLAIEKEFTKSIVKLMGTINSEGDRVIPSEEYKTFHDINFETIVKGLPIATIKKKYSKLFNITQIAREKDKKVNPVTGKVTYPGKGIFEIKPIPKAQFGSYFLNGKLTTLRARQKALATEIAQALAKDAAYEISKSPEIITKIQQLQEAGGSSIAFGVANEIQNIANQLDKKKTEKASLDVVKFSKDFDKLDNAQQDKLLNGLKEFGDMAAKYDAKTAFEEVYGKDKPFGKFTKSIFDDLDTLVQTYAIAKETHTKFGKKIPVSINEFITDEIKAASQLQTVKDILNLDKGSLDFQSLQQLESGRKAAKIIVDRIGPDLALRFFPFLYSTGRIGGTSAVQGKHGLERRDADYWLDKIEQADKKILEEKKEEVPDKKKIKSLEAKIQKYFEAIKEGKEPTSHPYALFASKADFLEFCGLPKNYKSKIPPNASQSVSKVNKDFNYKEDKKSADRNKKFLINLADKMKELRNEGLITQNDIGMIQMALGNAGMSTPIAAAAQVKYMTNDGVKTSKKHIYEHLIPRKVINAAMTGYITGAVKGNDFNTLLDNFSVAVIPKSQAKIIDVYYKSSMPSNWDLTKDPLDRYFNALTLGSVNLPLLNLETGKIDPRSESYSNLLRQDIKHSKDLSDAVLNSRSSSKEIKGISILDFDDTLATTKSGVRATMPNIDGLPKPGRKVIFLAGGAGSGKSSVVNKLRLQDQGFKIVNSDISLEWLKKNSGLPENMNDLTKEQRSTLGKLQHQARGIAKRKMIKFQGKGDGVIIDGTGGSLNVMNKQVKEFQDAGYDVSMLFVETSLETALERNANRKERSLLDVIVRKNHEAVQGNKQEFKKLFGKRFMQVKTDNLTLQDPMPGSLTRKMNDFVSGYEKRRLDAEEFASQGADLLAQGAEFDFSEFNIVKEGETAPLFNKALKLQSKFGTKDMFVLTARPAESAPHIHKFLKANGLNIPLKNITGLANSTPEAKALWVAEKFGEGYNDFYFADDALQNVQAVQNVLDQLDVKSKVQQAKVKFSKDLDLEFNNVLENVTGIDAAKRFSQTKARKRGSDKGKFRFFIPPSHEDFVGLLYNFMGKGREGDKHRDFFEKALIKPLNRAYREIDAAKQAIANDYKSLNKQFPQIKKKLLKNTPDGDFTFQDAIRVYLWNKHGYTIPGLSKTDQQNLVDIVTSDSDLQTYAETLNLISKQKEYVDPGPNWETGNIRIDLVDATGRVGRASYFTEFNENAEIIFSEENLNKIEAAYGKSVRESLEDMLHRIKTGVNRPKGSSSQPNAFMNWLNASVSGVMFFNTRSALLQQLSNVNFINFADNNIFAAAKAFANQKQYWEDFAMIFNSDMLKQRRGGIQTDINGAELADAIKKARPGNYFDQVAIITGKALKLGFLPTQIGDSIAIATGGATFYRNRVNKYIKDGMSTKEAEAAAFTDLQDITNSTQQSARPDMTSKQQAMWIGKLVLNFLNTPSQYNRIIKKAGSDIINRRITPPNTTQMQSDMSNMSRILYYGAIQNMIFYGLQTAMFAVMFGDEDEDNEKFLEKRERVINGAVDTILRGSGIYGVAVSTIKNMAIKFLEQREKGYNKDESAVIMEALNFSPVVGIKARKIVNAEKTLNYNRDIIKEMETFDIDNPMWSAVTNYIEVAGPPANRIYQKTTNLRDAMNNDYTALQRVMLFSGYTRWSLGIGDTKKMIEVKETVKEKKKQERKEKTKIRREEKKKEQEEANKAVIEENKKKSKKDGICSAVNRKGERCNNKVVDGKSFCTIHEKVEQSETGVKKQCTKIKSDGKRCKMMTSSKSGLCYYHD